MKICYVCMDPGIPVNGRKGCSTHIRETVEALMELGHQVKLVCTNIEGDPNATKGMDVVKVDPFHSKKLGFDMRHILLDYRLRRKLEEIVRDWRPDAIYERYSLYSRAGTAIARRHHLPRLVEVNAFLTHEQKGRIRWPRVARKVEVSIMRRAPHLIVVSEPLVEEMKQLGQPAEAITKMPMAVNIKMFNPGIDGTEISRQHELDGKFVIGYVGTLAGWHGIRLLYDMARELKNLNAPPFVFLIVGGDTEKLEMHRRKSREAGLDDVLRFIGSVPHAEVPRHIRAMDAAIVPDTTYWATPAKLFEYQASGVPVLAPDYQSIRDVLVNGEEGFIFPAEDPKQMAGCALKMMRSPALLRLMAIACRARVERERSWRHNAEGIIALLKKVNV